MKPISKTLLRKVLLDYRRLLYTEVYLKRNGLLCKNLLDFIKNENFKTIHTFLPIEKNNEPDITRIFPDLLESGGEIIISKTNFEKKTQEHFFLDEDTRLEKNNMGIPEPVDAQPADINEVDLILVPLLVADKMGNRIGYGGGYYDRLLKETSAMKVGLSLSPPLDKIIQAEDWDISLDKIITPFDLLEE